MKAEQFIKDHGLEKAREVVEGAPDKTATHFVCINFPELRYLKYKLGLPCTFRDDHWKAHRNHGLLEDDIHFYRYELSDLKRLVESVDLVNKLNGIDKCKGYVQVCFFKGRDKYGNRIKQAIADYESIYGEGSE